MKLKYIFSILFIILSIIIFMIGLYDKNNDISEYTKDLSIKEIQNYNSLYAKYAVIAKVIFNTKINTPQVLKIFKDAKDSHETSQIATRKNLYDELADTYETLKKVNIKQLHFHLPNNDSFLRFHKPEKFGDNLSNIRETIKYVNNHKKTIDGFEEGRIYNGYRFVFPLVYNKEHLGSVEVSFSAIAISSDFLTNYKQFATLLMSQEVINEKVFKNEQSNYAKSIIDGFFYEKKQLKSLEANSNFILPTSFSKDFQSTFTNNLHSNKDVFTIFDYELQQLFTFIKLKNPITKNHVALFMIESDPKYIIDKINFFYMFLILNNILLFSIIYIIYKEFSYSTKMKNINEQLRESLKIIKESQEKLIESEKMASLGALVSGVAHEVNTPLGNAVTVSSIIRNETKSLMRLVNEGSLKKSTLLEKLENLGESSKLLLNNLNNAADLIKNFKKISVDQSHEISREFNVFQYVNDIFLTYKSQLKQIPVEIEITYNEQIIINSYPGVFAQIFNNLIQNSILHGFETKKENAKISVHISKENNELCMIYKDNGSGVKEEIIDKIFDPFVTTKRNAGGTGLGMNIVYNLITQKLMGSLKLETKINEGTTFTMTIPLS